MNFNTKFISAFFNELFYLIKDVGLFFFGIALISAIEDKLGWGWALALVLVLVTQATVTVVNEGDDTE